MRVIIPLIIFIFYPLISYGNSPYSKHSMPDSFKDYVPYKLYSNMLFLSPELSKAAKYTKGLSPEGEPDFTVSFTLKKKEVYVSFDPGPSEDPTFVIGSDLLKDAAYLNGEELYISSSGSFYLSKRSNESFKRKLKFILTNGRLKEVSQPFFAVNSSCSTSALMVMYDGKCNSGNVIAKIPEGRYVKILLMENSSPCSPDVVANNEIGDRVNNYLVSTPFGLVGWVASSTGYLTRPGNPLSCLRYFGD